MRPTLKRKKQDKLVLHVIIADEEDNKSVRAYCFDCNLAVNAHNTEQAMTRMESMILTHLNYALQNKSNPWHLAEQEVMQMWWDDNPKHRSWFVEVGIGKPRPKVTRKYRLKRLEYA